jgi:hypothetical protein
MNEAADRPPFELSGVVYLAQPAGRAVANLDELLAQFTAADRETVFLHTQMPRLRPHTGEDLPVDDLSAWVGGVVQDTTTAERLAFAMHAANPEVEDVRAAILRVLEAIPARTRLGHAAPVGGALVLLRFDVVTVPTGVVVSTAGELMEALTHADRIVWFHHLVEEAWMLPGPIPVAEWVRAAGSPKLADVLEREAASGRSVDQMRARVLQRWRRSHIASRLAESSRDGDVAAGTREAASLLARRLLGTDRRTEQP